MRSNEKIKGGTRTKVIRNGPLGREVELTWRGPTITRRSVTVLLQVTVCTSSG